MTRTRRLALVAIPILVALAAGGCATTGRQDAWSTEDLLVAAGFRQQPGDTSGTSEEPAGPGTRLPLSVVPRMRNGQLSYTYVDPYGCKCVYVGTPENYLTYTQLHSDAVTGATGPRAVDTAGMHRDLMDRDVWAPWLPQ